MLQKFNKSKSMCVIEIFIWGRKCSKRRWDTAGKNIKHVVRSIKIRGVNRNYLVYLTVE